MIDWMQRHKKWLVITIWISTIAFVGAGFVGWGSYSFGKSGSTVASVGDRNIEYKDLQKEYNNLYAQYQQMFGNQFNQEMAEKLKLQDQAVNNLIQKNLLLNLADEIGLDATDNEIAATLVQYEAFLKDGKFDKAQYQQVLKQNRSNTVEFEESLSKDLTIQKTMKALSLSTDKATATALSNLFFVEDKISIHVIDAKNIKINYTQDELKAFYEKNKNDYKSLKQYKLKTSYVDIQDKDQKISKKEALKKYLSLKKKESTFEGTTFIDESTTFLTKEDMDKIFKSKIGDFIKPIALQDKYMIAQIEEIIEPKVLSYEKVKTQIKSVYEKQLQSTKLNAKKDDLIKNFKGKDVGYVSKEKTQTLDKLSKEETTQFLNQLFSSQNSIGSVEFDDKIVVFKILDSKLATNKEDNINITQNIDQILNNVMVTKLIESLEKQYKITKYFKE